MEAACRLRFGAFTNKLYGNPVFIVLLLYKDAFEATEQKVRELEADIDDVLVRATFHIDDGRDYTNQIIHRLRQNFYIHEGICPPLPPTPKVAEVKLTPVEKARNKRGKLGIPTYKLNDSQKSPRIVHVNDLAAHIDKQIEQASKELERIQFKRK
ncbi:pyocin activator PrtN family protein [Xenorhabdus sp. XENO-7]|uniref:Pyocin activator PrtN family protein n=1 Tax=Xenorhabdus aichiensis TaxID=3025874 RepID=A0ABT5M8R8_9GAMM|nr:pyocin activator PrtN family protein [Xenorhabdus aichiensis]MDC9622661.1 pyocin activator PrtN family protein [Xenorhabdus aichiensis]